MARFPGIDVDGDWWVAHDVNFASQSRGRCDWRQVTSLFNGRSTLLQRFFANSWQDAFKIIERCFSYSRGLIGARLDKGVVESNQDAGQSSDFRQSRDRQLPPWLVVDAVVAMAPCVCERERERERKKKKRQASLESIDGAGGRQSAATSQSYATVWSRD